MADTSNVHLPSPTRPPFGLGFKVSPQLLLVMAVSAVAVAWLATGLLLRIGGAPDLTSALAHLGTAPDRDAVLKSLGATGALVLLLQGGLLLLAFGVLGKLLGRKGVAGPWLPINRGNLRYQLRVGLLAAAPALLLMKLVLAVNARAPLGEPPTAWVVFEGDWSPAFWVFMAVGSYGLVPVLEELVYRGRMAALLEVRCGGRLTAVLTGLFFGLIHGQFYKLDTLNLMMLGSLALAGIVLGVVALHTRSLVGPIVIHACMNVPLAPPFDLLAVLLAVVFLRSGLRLLNDAWTSLSVPDGIPVGANRVWLYLIAAGSAVGLIVVPEWSLAVGVTLFVGAAIYVRRRAPRLD